MRYTADAKIAKHAEGVRARSNDSREEVFLALVVTVDGHIGPPETLEWIDAQWASYIWRQGQNGTETRRLAAMEKIEFWRECYAILMRGTTRMIDACTAGRNHAQHVSFPPTHDAEEDEDYE